MKEYKGIERRKYIRLKSVFPVEFKLMSPDGKSPISELLQGYTADVSKGGILLRVNNIKPELCRIIEEKSAKLLLDINIPLGLRPVKALSSVAWTDAFREDDRTSCRIGLSFEKIDDKDRERLVGYTTSLARIPRLAAVMLLVMLAAFSMEKAEEMKLRRDNAILVSRISLLSQKKSVVAKWLDEAAKEKEVLLAELERQSADIAEMEILRQKLDKLSELEKTRLEELTTIEAAQRELEEATVDNMYNWLKVHQNKRTGLIASFEGDSGLKNTGFIYDQSLVAQVFLLRNDIESAKMILDFFKYRAEKNKGGFTNAYGVNNGAVTEYAVHSGPNIWLGIALMQYMEKARSGEYLELAKDIADWIIEIQAKDKDGGIRGGPEIGWFATEHNLDAYAYFAMLAEKTGEKRYKDAARKTLDWIKNNAYTSEPGRIQRGKGDSTIATDTFAWAIAAIGPKGLIEAWMDPDAIMEFAEENCSVSVDFVRPDGYIVRVTGFDFAKQRNIARGGVVSSEWTAQMVVSLKMMGDFYKDLGNREKAKLYYDKGNFYINELEKMVITSPSRSGQGAGCLPYATSDDVDTGHGWRTPRGRDTGSVSSTAYAIFALEGYNPLKLTSSK